MKNPFFLLHKKKILKENIQKMILIMLIIIVSLQNIKIRYYYLWMDDPHEDTPWGADDT